MPLKLEEARQVAIRQLRERLDQIVPPNVTISDIEIVSSERKDIERRIYNKLTIERRPCDFVFEHWIVNGKIQFTIQYTATLPNGDVVRIQTLSRWFRFEESEILRYYDCGGLEDLPPLPEGHCSVMQEGAELWSGTTVAMYNGKMNWPDDLAWAMEVGYDGDDFPDQGREQRKV